MMRNKILIAIAPLVLSLPLLQACERSDRSPTASTPGSSSDRQARTPSAQDRMLESAPPAAGAPSTPSSPSGNTSGSPSSSGSGSTSGSMSGGSSSGSSSSPGASGSSGNQSGDTR